MDSVTVPSLKAAKIEQLHNTVKDSEVQLSLIRDRLDKLNKKGSTVQQNNSKDWTAIYERCMDWEKIEDLKEQKTKYEQTLETIANHQETMGHYHDHSKEKEFFELPEVEKIRQCHANKDIGNYLFSEGNFRRAIDHYQTAVCYYEYCFPEDDVLQEELDNFRHSCLCNLALCYIRTGNYRAAIDSAERVLQENGDHSKALYRKAQAHRYLDEFE